MKATLVFIFGPNLKTKTLLRPRPKLNNSETDISPSKYMIYYKKKGSGEKKNVGPHLAKKVQEKGLNPKLRYWSEWVQNIREIILTTTKI